MHKHMQRPKNAVKFRKFCSLLWFFWKVTTYFRFILQHLPKKGVLAIFILAACTIQDIVFKNLNRPEKDCF